MSTQQLGKPSVFAIAVFDIDGVVRDVGGSYRRALADTVEQFTQEAYRPSQSDIDALKTEGLWNNDWEASREFVYRYFEAQGKARSHLNLDYDALVAFFQSRYRGTEPDPDHWTGYICQEPLLLSPAYLEQLTQAGISWGFFSGATRGSATYVLEKRLGLRSPILVAMEDAPGKPDPTGLLEVVRQLQERDQIHPDVPVLYIGDTVADMQTVVRARSHHTASHNVLPRSTLPYSNSTETPVTSSRRWVGVGILPPHAQTPLDYATTYSNKLQQAGASIILTNVEQLTPTQIQTLISSVNF